MQIFLKVQWLYIIKTGVVESTVTLIKTGVTFELNCVIIF